MRSVFHLSMLESQGGISWFYLFTAITFCVGSTYDCNDVDTRHFTKWQQWNHKQHCLGTDRAEEKENRTTPVSNSTPKSTSPLQPAPLQGQEGPTLFNLILSGHFHSDSSTSLGPLSTGAVGCEVVLISDGCPVDASPCNQNMCASVVFKEANAFVARTSFLGALRCTVLSKPSCTCFFPGLGQCRKNKGASLHVIGDSTLRQFSYAWEVAAANYQDVVVPIIRRQEKILTTMNSSSAAAATAAGRSLCQEDIKFHFARNGGPIMKDGKRGYHVPPKMYQQAFMEADNAVPAIPRAGPNSIAVFNYGLHLLGGYVDNTRWVSAEHGSAKKIKFVTTLDQSYPALLRDMVAALRKQHYTHIVYRNTNAVSTEHFIGSWKESTEACIPDTPKTDARKCQPFVDSCVKVNGEDMKDACRRLAFDSAGTFRVNEVAASTLLNRPKKEYSRREEVITHDPFFNSRAIVDGYLDAQALTRNHPECNDDGRHYFQLELGNVRTLSDATGYW